MEVNQAREILKLTEQEVDSLMEELLRLPNPFTCPHGRPTIITYSNYELERLFKRVMN